MSTPNELISALQRAKVALTVDLIAYEQHINPYFIQMGVAPVDEAVIFLNQEIAAIDAVIESWYDAK